MRASLRDSLQLWDWGVMGFPLPRTPILCADLCKGPLPVKPKGRAAQISSPEGSSLLVHSLCMEGRNRAANKTPATSADGTLKPEVFYK